MTGRTLVAGVGNIFMRDDAFGVEVARLLAQRPRREGVEIADFGIRSMHLVYELLDGCDLLVLIDVARRGCQPGTVTVLEVRPEDAAPPAAVIDAHGLAPGDIFAMLASMGGRPGRSLLVACEPADLGAGIGLSDQVRAALPHAVRAVEEILGYVSRQDGAQHGAQDYRGGDRSGAGRRGRPFAAGHQALLEDQEDVRGVWMHEFGLCEGVLETVLRRAAGRPVTGIRIRCGVRHAVDPAAMRQAFGLMAAGTPADGATVDVLTVPATVNCRDCGATADSADPLAACGGCGGVNVTISGGDELMLESVRYAAG